MINKSLFRRLSLLTLCAFFLGIIFFNAPDVFAQQQAGDPLGLQFAQDTGLGTQDIRVTIANIIRVFLGLLGIVSVGLILYGGFVWMTAGGDESKVAQAKKILTNSVIGLVIVLASFSIATFVINSLADATGGGGQVVGGPGGGAGGGGGLGGGGGTVFKVDAITPTGSIPIRNVVVRIYLSQAVDPQSITNNIIVRKKSDNSTVAGTLSASGNEITFVPSTNCPAPNTQQFCFDASQDFSVTVSNGANGVKTQSNQQLSCALGSICTADFTTGTQIDTQDPTVSITYPQDNGALSEGFVVPVQVSAADDSGVASVELFVDNQSISPLATPNQNSTQFSPTINWDTTGLALGSTPSLRAKVKDISGKEVDSSNINVTIRAAHCFNKDSAGNPLQDADETGPNCGGQDCAACNGATCSQNNQCSSGACINGTCAGVPTIINFSPDDGAAGSYITILGTGFGKFSGSSSKVYLIDSQGTRRQATLPAQCSSPWSDSQIIAEVPQVLQNGDYDIEVITSTVCNQQTGAFCTDDTLNNRGVIKTFAVDSAVVRPAICNANPAFGKPGDRFDILGKNFTSSQGTVHMGQFTATVGGSWTATEVKGAIVPNLLPGTIPVQVEVGGVRSNSVDYQVSATQLIPSITNISPDNGDVGQYITISGEHFGLKIGKVFFKEASSNNQVLADTNFPQACGTTWWSDRQITVKVPDVIANTPALARGAYRVYVETDAGPSAEANFTINTNAVTPGLCSVTPSAGPANTIMTLTGENFGSQQGIVTFLNNDQAQISSWADGAITLSVPQGLKQGLTPVRVVVGRTGSNPGVQSNAIDFSVGRCTTCPNANEQCCPDGSCQLQCSLQPRTSTFEWRFSTGNIANTSSNQAPVVIENPLCKNNQVQSPSPFGESIDACTNASLVAQFSTPMKQASLNSSSITLTECTDRQNCGGPTFGSSIFGSFTYTRDAQNKVIGFTVPLTSQLKTDTWYKGIITSGQGGAVSETNVSLDSDYEWFFKTASSNSSCTLTSVAVTPPAATVNVQGGTQELVSLAQAQNCNVLSGINWQWNTANTSQVGLKSIAGQKATVEAKSETGNKPVDVSASALNKSASSQITVDFTDPEVITQWPGCTEACINAGVGAEFNIEMEPNTIKSGVTLYECQSESCVRSNLSNVSINPEFVKPNNPQTNEIKYVVNFKPVQNLKLDTFYLAVIDGNVKSVNGTSLTKLNYDSDNDGRDDSYSWKFRTKQNNGVCTIDNVEIAPLIVRKDEIGAQQAYSATPISSPDACSPTGQILKASDYSWAWTSSDTNRAIITSHKYSSTLPVGCNGSCLNTGSTWYTAICGDGYVDIGEACDDGNTTNGDGCSDQCLFEGNSSTCGNGVIDSGEACDDSNTRNGDGCSDQCLFEGSSLAYGSSCGNRSQGTGEQCDDGNIVGGDGCSTQCLFEGSKIQKGIPVCGNSIVEAGEECDIGGECTGGTNNGAACVSNRDCGAGGICKSRGSSVCTDRCLLAGATNTKCGDGTLEKNNGEQCDDGNKDDGDGCNSRCLLEGSGPYSSGASLCGNGLPLEVGEACEATAPTKGSPFQWATIKGFIADSGSPRTSTTQIKASTVSLQNPQVSRDGTGDLILECGYTSDGQCNNPNTHGIALDTCCYQRPTVASVLPVDDPNYVRGVCTNTLIEATFDLPMDETSFSGNVILAEAITQGNCSPNTEIVFEDQYKFDKTERTLIANVYYTIKDFFSTLWSRLFGGGAIAAPPSGLKWCVSPIAVNSTLDQSGKKLTVTLNEFLKQNTFYRVIVRGDESVTDNVISGITSKTGIGYNGPQKFKDIDGTMYTARLWSFETSQTCQLSGVKITNSEKNDTNPFIYTKGKQSIIAGQNNFEARKNFKAQGLDQRGNPINPTSNYSWTWNWDVGPTDIFDTTGSVSGDNVIVEAQGKDGTGAVQATATIVNTPFPGLHKKCSIGAGQCVSGKCYSDTTFTTECTTGSPCGTEQAPAGVCSLSYSSSEELTSFICENPWPNPAVSTKASLQVKNGFLEETKYNFKIRYCRDQGSTNICFGGTTPGRACGSNSDCGGNGQCLNNIDDDLPLALVPVVRDVQGKICTAGDPVKLNNACTNNASCGANGVCSDTDLLAEYLLVMQQEQKTCHGGTNNSLVCSEDSDCAGSGVCYSEQGQNLQNLSDAIGLRIMQNPKHLSARDWYEQNIGVVTSVQDLGTVDGYRAIRDGRSVYINAVNTQNNVSKSFFTNIYILSYSEGASPATVAIFEQIVSKMQFNINLAPTPKAQATRDTHRLEDLRFIEKLLQNYKNINGTYPVLQAGTFVEGMSFSTWPSWQNTLGQELGRVLPIDPQVYPPAGTNKFAGCPDIPNKNTFNELTCWDSSAFQFDARLLDNNGLLRNTSPQSYVYQYVAQGVCSNNASQRCYTNSQCGSGNVCTNIGSTYTFDYNVEFVGKTVTKTCSGGSKQGAVCSQNSDCPGSVCTSNASGGSAYQCFDENANAWVNNGAYHTSVKHTQCVLGTWTNTCGNGVLDIVPNNAALSEQCDGSNVNYCDAQNGNRVWNNEFVQVCNSSCELTQPPQAHQCGGYCGDGNLDDQYGERCEINQGISTRFGGECVDAAGTGTGTRCTSDSQCLIAQGERCQVTCSVLGWGDEGEVGCDPNSCGYYGAGCSQGPLNVGDVRLLLAWEDDDSDNGNEDLDIHLDSPVQGGHVFYTNRGSIFSSPNARLSWDDTSGQRGPDINNDGDKDGLEILTFTKPSGQSTYNGNGSQVYKVYVHSYDSGCLATSCSDISLQVNRVDGQQFTFTPPTQGRSTTNNYWHVFNMDNNGQITEVNTLLSAPPQ